MRIAIDIGPLHGHRTGVGTAVAHLVHHLGADTSLDLQPYLLSFKAKQVAGQIRLPLPARVATRCWARLDVPSADRWLSGAEVVHGTNYVVPPTRRPSVISVYDCWFLAHPEHANPDVTRAGMILRRAADRGAWIHTSSEATAREARRLLDTDRVRAIHLGPPDPIVEPAERPGGLTRLGDHPFVLAIGTTERRKRHPWLAEVFATIDTDLHLVHAGATGDDSDALLHTIAGLPKSVSDRIHLLGPVDSNTRSWLLRNAAVVAYPSVDEGFGFPILEAQSVGAPMVATKAGSIPEVGGDGLVTIERDDREGFAEAITSLAADGAERTRIIEAGTANLERFSWARTTTSIVELYRTALESA
ncbi:MAG: glycosyltransferase family 4 protein [Ilumatobacteraceae bacterium]